MKITKIQVDSLEIPLIHPYHLSQEYGIVNITTPIIVSIFTDEGITGYGECDPWPLFTGDSAQSVQLILEKHIAPVLIGKDPTNINEIHRIMDTIIRNQNLTKSAVDMAVYDILGKSVGLPAYQFLGGKLRNKMRCMWSVGGNSPEETAEQVVLAKQQGYDGCMIKIGSSDYRSDADCTRTAREAVGKDYPLIVDANQGWDVDTAIRYWKLIKNCGILFFEQPLQSWDVKGMAKIRRAIDIPLSADESVVTIQDARRLSEAEAVDIFSIKVSKNGGIQPAKEICDFADANGIQVFFNSMIEAGITQAASLQVGVTCSNLVRTIGHAYFSPNRLKSDICSYHTQIHPDEGFTYLSDRPGLGVEMDWDAEKSYIVDTKIIK